MRRGILRKIVYISYLWFTWLAYRLFDKLILYRTEITITQKCTLNCEKCANLIPYIDTPITFDVKDIKQEMNSLFDCVDRICILRILGGEPFVHKDIVEIVKQSTKSSKVKRVEIVTNGTIRPSEEILAAIRDKKVCIVISDYHELSNQKDNILNDCRKNNVKCRLDYSKPTDKWLDAGEIKKRNRSNEQLQKQLLSCAMMCRNVQNGRLYYCPRASFGSWLGIKGKENDSVDLLCSDIGTVRKQIFLLNQRRMVIACDYCDMGTSDMKTIEIANQLKPKKKC